MLIIWSEGNKEGEMTFKIPKGFNSTIYLIKGQISLKGYGIVSAEELAFFDNDGNNIQVSITEEKSQFILLCGKPIDERK